MRKTLFSEVRNFNTQRQDIICDKIVAQAAPVTPIWKRKMK